MKLRAGELKQREEIIQKEKENLEKLRVELEVERERLNAAAMHLKHQAHEVESLSKVTHTHTPSCTPVYSVTLLSVEHRGSSALD